MADLINAGRVEIHASPLGSLAGDGTADYPVRTLERAVEIARLTRSNGRDAVIWLHSGAFPLSQTLRLGPDDSNTTFAAWPLNSEPVSIDGGQTLRTWTPDRINGHDVWSSDAPAHAGRSLFVNGTRLSRPRFPRTGFLRIAGQSTLDLGADLSATLFEGTDIVGYSEGDVPELVDPTGVEVVVPHFWIQERMPVARIDTAHRTIHSSYTSILCLRDGVEPQYARYYLDGVVDELGAEPGEWYLDSRGTVPTELHPNGYGRSRVLYVPTDQDRREDFTATIPVVEQLVSVCGGPDRAVHGVRFEGILFQYADFAQAPAACPPFQMREDPVLDPATPYASDPQAAATVPGAVQFQYSTSCALVDCTITHVGGYAIGLASGSQYILVSGCDLVDLGAGGVACGGSEDPVTPEFNCGNEISDNTIHAGGRVYPHCVAVLFRHGSGNVIAYNDIEDFFSSGISVGWKWDYGFSPSRDNLVIGNHLHDLGQGVLDWFGAVYTLGVSPGTQIRENLIHDITAAGFGGWGILLDPASSHIVIEANVVHDVSHEAIHIKTGRENIIRNNVFAFGAFGQVSLAVPEDHLAATIEHNLFVGHGVPAFVGAPGSASVTDVTNVASNLNLFWDDLDTTGLTIAGDAALDRKQAGSPSDFAPHDEWRSRGSDTESLIADPGLIVNADGTITLTHPDIAGRVGFTDLGALSFGPRDACRRRHPGRRKTSPYRLDTESDTL